jgi:hypothetical protein
MEFSLRSLSKNVIAVAFIAFVLQFSISIFAVSKNPWTPFDEATHFDYIIKISKGHLPSVNEKYGQDALSWMACSEPRAEAWKGLAGCGSEFYDPSTAPFWGQSPATGYPPNYYLLTAVPYEICDRVTTRSDIVCARVANSMWLSFSASAVVLLMMAFGASALLSLIVAIGYATLPAVLLQGITVNPDAAAQFLAPSLVLIAMYLARGRLSQVKIAALWFASIFFLLPIKQTLIPIGLIATLFLIDWLSQGLGRRETIRNALIMLAAYVGGVATSFVVQLLQIRWRGLGGDDHLGPFLKQEWEAIPVSLNQAISMTFQPFGQMVWGPFGDGRLVTIAAFVAALGWIALFAERHGGVLVKAGEASLPKLRSITITGSFLVAIVGPLVLAIALWLKYETAPVTARYYMATAMTLGAIGIASTSNKSLRILFGALMIFSTIVTIRILIGITL